MTNVSPLLSIVIPTKNRYRTLLPLCDYLLSKDGDFEIIISDNSDSNDDFLSFIENKKRDKIQYIYSKDTLSMRDNCERGIKLAKGEFITMIGDDDAVIIDSALKCINNMKLNGLDFALSNDCKYLWPNLKTKLFGIKNFGVLRHFKLTKSSEVIDAKTTLKAVADQGGVTIGNMPRLYQGIVKTSYVKQSISEDGSIFLASMPDMSSSTLLATKVNKGLRYKVPFMVNGVSSNSGGGLGAAGKHKGELSQGYGLSQKDIEEWPDNVPNFWSGGTVWAASYIITLKKLNKLDVIDFNKSALLAYCIVFQPSLTRKFEAKNLVKLLSPSVCIKILRHVYLRLKSLTKNYFFYSFQIQDKGLETTYDLLNYLERKIKNEK